MAHEADANEAIVEEIQRQNNYLVEYISSLESHVKELSAKMEDLKKLHIQLTNRLAELSKNADNNQKNSSLETWTNVKKRKGQSKKCSVKDKKCLMDQSTTDAQKIKINKWQCSACTFHNEKNQDFCELCKSKYSPQQEVKIRGPQCSKCTLVNLEDAITCQACGSSLKNALCEDGDKEQPLQCPMCTMINLKNARVCEVCGANLGI